MINKKKLPLRHAQDIHDLYDKVRSYATTKNDLITIIEDKELKLLLIDNDSQSNLSQILNVESQYNLYDLYSNSKVKQFGQ